jgi:two-component system response regulator NreC
MPIRIVLADDHVLVRQGLKSLLEREGFQVVAEASDGQEALSHVQSLQPDIVVMDISRPTLNGLNAAQKMSRSSPKTKTILLTQHDESQYIREALEAGVKGYVLKSQVASDLLLAIRQVSRGQVYLSPGVSSAVMEAYHSKSEKSKNPLTMREKQVLQLIAEGKIHQRRRIFAWHQRENSRITSRETHAEAGYSRDSEPRALRRP